MAPIDWDGATLFWRELTSTIGGRALLAVTVLTVLTPFFKWGLPPIGDFIAKVIGAIRK